jgi:hypothetical protein
MMSALSRQDEALQILPNEKYSPNGFPTNEKPRDFALTLRTILSRDGVIDCLAHHLEHDLQWEVNRMQDPVSEDGTRVDLVVYPDPGMTTVYHVSAYARNARPGIVRVRVRPGKVPTKAHPGS